MKEIILASQSPRRKQLLEWAEIPFRVVVSNTDESFPEGLDFNEAALYIARQKAIAVEQKVQEKIPVLAADTVVICNGRLLGKPANKEEAIDMLQMISGNTHEVITAVVILYNGREFSFTDTTSVAFNELTHDQIEFYVSKYKPYDKAGAYAIQEWIGVTGIKSISGDFYNVMGLPVNRVVQVLTTLV